MNTIFFLRITRSCIRYIDVTVYCDVLIIWYRSVVQWRGPDTQLDSHILVPCRVDPKCAASSTYYTCRLPRANTQYENRVPKHQMNTWNQQYYRRQAARSDGSPRAARQQGVLVSSRPLATAAGRIPYYSYLTYGHCFVNFLTLRLNKIFVLLPLLHFSSTLVWVCVVT